MSNKIPFTIMTNTNTYSARINESTVKIMKKNYCMCKKVLVYPYVAVATMLTVLNFKENELQFRFIENFKVCIRV